MAKKIAVVAANGKAGRLIVKEAVERGNDVTAHSSAPRTAPPRPHPSSRTSLT